jgi:Skp family chaperone for outer membrane proteins
MKKFLLFVLVLAVGVGALGYWREWFTVNKEGKVDVQVDSAKSDQDRKSLIQVDSAKFDQDRKAFSKSVGAKAKTLKDDVAHLWKKSESLSGDEKTQAQKELGELQTKHDRLEQQLKQLDDAGQDKFDSIKQDLEKSLEEVEKKIEELTKKLNKGKDK